MRLSSLRSLIGAWRAVGEGWPRAKHNWALPPLGRDSERRKGEERRETETAASAHSLARTKLLARDLVRQGGIQRRARQNKRQTGCYF